MNRKKRMKNGRKESYKITFKLGMLIKKRERRKEYTKEKLSQKGKYGRKKESNTKKIF